MLRILEATEAGEAGEAGQAGQAGQAYYLSFANRLDLASGDASRKAKILSLALISDRRDPRRNSHASTLKQY